MATILSPMLVGASYGIYLDADGGISGGVPGGVSVSYGVFSGTLPPGLTVNAFVGVLTGIPTTAGTYTFDVMCVSEGTELGWEEFSVIVSVPSGSPPSITTTSLPNGSVGTSYNQTLLATGGIAPYVFQDLAGGLPPGILLNGSDGALTGIPTMAGSYTFSVKVFDSQLLNSSSTFTIVISNGVNPLSLTTSSLPDGTVGVSYGNILSAEYGVSPYSFSISAGTLPNGLTLNSISGTITGTPSSPGTFDFTATVTDSVSSTSSANLSVVISYAPPPPPPSPGGQSVGPLDVTEFAFNVTQPPAGITVKLNGLCNTPGNITAQLIIGGVPVGAPKIATCPVTSFGGPLDLWGTTGPNVNDTTFGVRFTASSDFGLAVFQINSVAITVSVSGASANFQYIKSFPASNGTLKTLAIDAEGEWWVEDVTNAPGVLTPLLSGLPVNGYAKSVTADDREYVCFNDLSTGNDIPRQYTGQWIDRITQVGPGAPPSFTPQVYTGSEYAISAISQPAAKTWGYACLMQSAGPGSNTAGNVVTIYYADSTLTSGDTDLIAAFNSGYPVYLWQNLTEPGTPLLATPLVVQVTSVGIGIPSDPYPPGESRPYYYYTYTVSSSIFAFGDGRSGAAVTYQRTLATMNMTVPVPGLIVGSRATITGASVSGYNSTWLISETPNSASMVITQTSVASGVATYSYSLSSGVAPTVGELVTVTGTTNANGLLNVINSPIAAASGGPTGTFTTNVSAPNTGAAAEEGLATTAGTQFDFDPGFPVLGSSTNPIYGASTGGNLIFQGTEQYISPGTRQGVVFFGTRNSAETFPSIPVTFTIPTNTSTLISSQIPIGPPNVTYRQIAITEPGQNGVPGGDFYTIDDPVTYIVNGITYTSTSFRIPDNTSTTISLTFRDSDLLAARRIDVQGEDLFNQVEIGNPAWDVAYAGRMFYGLTQQKVQNFLNLSFDGGYLPSTTQQPLGWSIAGSGGSLIASPIFGNSYYVQNTTGSLAATLGLLTQSAYQDYYDAAIINPNIPYSVRVTARIPSGNTGGNLVIDLFSAGGSVGSFTIPFASMTTTMQTFSGVLTTGLAQVPSDLTYRIYGTNMANGADYEIDRSEVFTTRQPVNTTLLLASYVGNIEGVDGVSGALDTNSENTQPCYGGVVMKDLLYLLKSGSLYYTQDSSGDEPADWGVHEVSNKAGACGVNAYDSGEEWILMANRNGVYLFDGGEPQKVSQEIQQVWDALNWDAGKSIWVRNDVAARRFYIGVPLPTPNKWLPNAPVNAAPVFPNVELMCSYQGSSTGSAITDADPVHKTFYGDILAEELERKWSIQQIPCPYADFITQANGIDAPLLFCNGIGNSKVYILDQTNDDGAEIPWKYTTYGFGSDKDVEKYSALGNGRKRWSLWRAKMVGAGTAIIKMLEDNIDAAVSSRNTYSITLDQTGDLRGSSCNATGSVVYVEISSGGIDSVIDLSIFKMGGTKDVFSADYVRD